MLNLFLYLSLSFQKREWTRWILNNYSLKSTPLFTEIEKNNCFSIYTGSDLNNIFRRKPLKIDSETLAKREFTPAILFLFGLRIIHS